MYVCICVCIYVCIHTCIYVYIFIYVYVSLSLSLCVYVCIYTHIYVCIYTHILYVCISIHTHTQGDTINNFGCGPKGPTDCFVGTTPGEHWARRPGMRRGMLRSSR